MIENLAQRLIWLGFVPQVDFMAQDNSDGSGPFIAQWLSAEPQPTEAEIAAAAPPAITAAQVVEEAQRRINLTSADARVNLQVFGTSIPADIVTLCTTIKVTGETISQMSPIPQDYAADSRWPPAAV